jgi:mannose/fructose/N-acetylgalactosamine-specific phosphotransferase system component IIC
MQQLLGSIIVAIAIVAVTIALVTAKLGPNAEEDSHGGDRQEQQDNSGRGGSEDR